MGISMAALAPGFLVASPPLGDPNFDRTLILLAAHGPQGALGFVVNRAAPVTLGELFTFTGKSGARVSDASPVLLGGPVQPSSGWILGIDPSALPEADGVIAVGDRIRVISSTEAFDTLARDTAARPRGERDEKRRIVMLGYSGWGPGQLESEIARGSWLPVPLDEGVLFDVDLDQRWESAYALLGVTPASMMSMPAAGMAS